MHVPENCNEICGELLQRGTLNDSLCLPSPSAFQEGNQRACLARALGAMEKLITGAQTPERGMEVLEGTQKDTSCVPV